jgi:uncharacterized membrane protein YwaF
MILISEITASGDTAVLSTEVLFLFIHIMCFVNCVLILVISRPRRGDVAFRS